MHYTSVHGFCFFELFLTVGKGLMSLSARSQASKAGSEQDMNLDMLTTLLTLATSVVFT